NRCPEAKRSDRADTGCGHEPTNLHVMTCQLQNLTVEIANLLFDGRARVEQRSDRSDQLRTILDQLLGSDSEDIELGTADDQTKVLKKAADLVLKVTLDLDQQCSACQERPDRVAVEILDAHFLEPT